MDALIQAITQARPNRRVCLTGLLARPAFLPVPVRVLQTSVCTLRKG